MEQEEYVSIFNDGIVWFNANMLRELISAPELREFNSEEALEALQEVLDHLERETVSSLSEQIFLDSGLAGEDG